MTDTTGTTTSTTADTTSTSTTTTSTTRPPLAGIHHVKIPVTDLARSVAFYADVFGFAIDLEFTDADGVMRGVAGHVPGLGDAMVSFRVNPAAAAGCAGFDPVSFAVADHAAIQGWAAHLDNLGIAHSPVIEASIGWLLIFDDPNGLRLHLYSWAAHGVDHSNESGYGRRVTGPGRLSPRRNAPCQES